MTTQRDQVAAFVAECVQADPEGLVTPEDARMAYVAWCSDRQVRPGTATGLSGSLVAAGGRRRVRPVRWEGVALLPLADSGYRTRNPRGGQAAGPQVDPRPALVALAGAGLVTDGRALDVALLRLTQPAPSTLCRVCGVLTYRLEEGTHAACSS